MKAKLFVLPLIALAISGCTSSPTGSTKKIKWTSIGENDLLTIYCLEKTYTYGISGYVYDAVRYSATFDLSNQYTDFYVELTRDGGVSYMQFHGFNICYSVTSSTI